MATNTINSKAEECAALIRDAQTIVALTGAGISTSAGIPDFRGPKGLYVTRKYDPEKVFDISYFYQDPKPFYQFAKDFVGLERTLKPTVAHRFFSELEAKGKLTGTITQNIDSLHQLAGSKKVYEMHGSFWLSHCLDCEKQFDFEQMKNKLEKEEVCRCSCQGVIKPDIVFFGENVKFFLESMALAQAADLFFIIGTSCVVYPAAMLPSYTRGKIVIVNQSDVEISSTRVALTVQEDIDEFFQKVAEKIFGV